MTETKWLGSAELLIGYGYLFVVWHRHSEATAKIPERRTLYDFLQTHPYVLLAIAFVGIGAYRVTH
jgi:hypothetical protein